MTVIRILLSLLCAAGFTLAARKYLHFLQLESYQLPGYKRCLRTRSTQWLPLVYAAVLAEIAAVLLSFLLTSVARGDTPRMVADCVVGVLLAGFCTWTYVKTRKEKEKKPFALTPRMKRLYGVLGICTAAVCVACALLSLRPFLAAACIPLAPILAATITAPYEKHINDGFYRDAQQTLASRPDLIKIGITGSFGKTSTKFILRSILSEKYCVLASPASFNTPMGLTRVIREQLEPRHEVFIAEMGARHKGDIAELVELVHPTIGLLTSVGAQHLETFGDMETVARTKYELIEGLGKSGTAFFVSDGNLVDKLYEKAPCEKYLVCNEGQEHAYYAENIQMTSAGSSFTLCLDGRKIPVITSLLGRHAVRNIVLAAACAAKLGLSDTEIARGVSKIRAVEHRLQLIPSEGGITIIDDAFNANPVGAAEALETLSRFSGRHIIVTPGFVEEGALENSMNRQLGQNIAKYADIAILVGAARAQFIAQGAREGGMQKERIHVVSGLREAQALLGKLARPGDTVLFENDLPDNYDGT